MQIKNNVKFIGLDISTSIIGICFMDDKYQLVCLDFLDLRKTKCMFEKSNKFHEKISLMYNDYSFDKDVTISIEESMQSFRSGFSSAKTISQLNRFNGIVSYIVSGIFKTVPVFINVNRARKNLDIKIDKKSSLTTKEQIFEWVTNDLKTKHNTSYDWPTKTLKSGPNKGVVKLMDSCYDMSDSYVICKAIKFNEI